MGATHPNTMMQSENTGKTMGMDPARIYDACVRRFSLLHGLTPEETRKLFDEETDFGDFIRSGRGAYYTHSSGWKFINPINEYITKVTGKIYPYYIPQELWDLYYGD